MEIEFISCKHLVSFFFMLVPLLFSCSIHSGSFRYVDRVAFMKYRGDKKNDKVQAFVSCLWL